MIMKLHPLDDDILEIKIQLLSVIIGIGAKIYKINPSFFVRSNNVFRDLESNASIQNIIREIKINQITD